MPLALKLSPSDSSIKRERKRKKKGCAEKLDTDNGRVRIYVSASSF